MTLHMERSAMAGSCTASATSVCSGPSSGADVKQEIIYSNPVDVTTDPGFALSVTGGGDGLSISGQDGTSFVDNNNATITTDGEYGLSIENDISGDLNLVSTGSVTSTAANGDGIRATNYGADTTVRANEAEGANNGINVNHYGTGSISITTTGMVVGYGTAGIFGDSQSGTSMTIEAVHTRGVIQGIFGRNGTAGVLNITSTGLARGTAGDGIRAYNSSTGTDVTVTAAETHGQQNGIFVQNEGTGALRIDSTGTATGDLDDGIYAYANASSTSATINAFDTTGGSSGIYLRHLGVGPVTVISTGAAVGGTSNGVSIQTGSDSTALNVSVNNAQGGDNGISTIHESLAGTPGNAATITATGNILGGSGFGISTESRAGVLTNININAGAVVESTAGNGISNDEGDSNVAVADGATVNGRVALGLGNDTVTLRGSLSGITVLDGGGGGTDVLNLSDASHATHDGGDIQNWSEINLDNSYLIVAGGNLNVGTAGDMTTGVFLHTGSTLDGRQDPLSLAGNLSLAAGTRFLASGNGSGTNTISGNVNNAGTISADGGGAGDTIRIGGDYIGNSGTVVLETELGDDTSTSDKLDIAGGTSGTSKVKVVNTTGVGPATNEGIELITVGRASDGVFTLVGDYQIGGVPVIVAGAYSYQLFKGNRTGTETNNWYLRSELISTDPDPTDPDPDPEDPDPEDPDPEDPDKPLYHPGVPAYEAYPQTLLNLNAVPTLQQRVGNRLWVTKNADSAGDQSGTSTASGVWARIEGAHHLIDPRYATAGTEFDQKAFKGQIGIDAVLLDHLNATLIGGISAHYTHGTANTYSIHGDGQISTSGYGLGSALTWYGDDGFYVDGQAHATWYQSDLRSVAANRTLIDGNDAFGYGLSLESGKRIMFDDGWSVTPQAQVAYSRVTFDGFVDVFGGPVSLDKGNSLQARLGLTLDHDTTWQAANGLTSRAHAYGIANIYYEFLNGTRVEVADKSFSFKKDRVWAGLGAGGSYNWNSDMYSLYAEGLVNTSLARIGDSYSLQGKVGFRVKW
jgi:outer membrane autotransporter protein